MRRSAFPVSAAPGSALPSARAFRHDRRLTAPACSLVAAGKFHGRSPEATWAQNGRKTPCFWAQFEEGLASKGNRISRNFAEVWSGRWESNPRPFHCNLLKIRASLSAKRAPHFRDRQIWPSTGQETAIIIGSEILARAAQSRSRHTVEMIARGMRFSRGSLTSRIAT